MILYFGIFGNYCYTVFVRQNVIEQNLRCDISGLLCVMSMMCVFMISSPSKEMFNTYLSVSPQDLSRVSILIGSRVQFQQRAECNSSSEQSSTLQRAEFNSSREQSSILVGGRVQFQQGAQFNSIGSRVQFKWGAEFNSRKEQSLIIVGGRV